ncbi:MAG TPA: hypothetical protein VN515_01010 [Terriglobales bacterium]|nr:hypothetical protein [Terriglobales bacterium]
MSSSFPPKAQTASGPSARPRRWLAAVHFAWIATLLGFYLAKVVFHAGLLHSALRALGIR